MTAPLLLITDIWGQHQTIEPLIAELEKLFPAVAVLDPYSGQRFVFGNSNEALGYFERRCSAAVYQQKVQDCLSSATVPMNILAFSAGADAVWPLLAETDNVAKAALVYGNSIPLNAQLKPNCPTQLWLCQEDAGVKTQQTLLNQHADLVLTEQGHGYFNPRSENYDPISATQDLAVLTRWLLRD